MHDEVLIDGVSVAADWLGDRGFQYGDGLFETIAVVDGQPCLWDAHMARLSDGCRQLNLPLPDPALLRTECQMFVGGLARAVLKIYWTAGDSSRGYRRPHPLKARRILRVSKWSQVDPTRHWVVRLCQHRLGDNPRLAGWKHLNRLEQVLGRSEWTDESADEGIMCGLDGRVVSGTMSNLIVQKGETLLTPPVDRAGIAGVVRGLFLALASDDPAAVRQDTLSVRQVVDADALYMTNSLIGVVRVRRFDDREYDMSVRENALVESVRAACHQPGEMA